MTQEKKKEQEEQQPKSKEKEKDSFFSDTLISIGLCVAIIAVGAFYITSNQDFNQLFNNSDVEQKFEQEEVDDSNGTLPSLKQTHQYNDDLCLEAITYIKETYNVHDDEELDNLIIKIGTIYGKLEFAVLPQQFQSIYESPERMKVVQTPYMGVFRDNYYCPKSDVYFFTHQEEMYNNIKLFSDINDQYIRQDLFGNFSIIASEMYGAELTEKQLSKERFALEVNINTLYLNSPQFLDSFLIGQQFGCLFQGLNKIPGSGLITHKEGLASTYNSFMKYVNQTNYNKNSTKKYSEKCMKEFKFLPQTYNLNSKEECKDFFQYVISENYANKTKQEGIQFISKLDSNVHDDKGINIVTQVVLDSLLKKYDKGIKCGVVQEKNAELLQEYINEPLLLNGTKFEIQMHFMIASVNPLIIYSQDKGGVSQCALKYNSFDPQIQKHACSVDSSFQHTLDSLQQALEKEGSIPSGWISNNLIPAVFRNYIHTALMSRDNKKYDSRFYEMYSSDILINKKNMQPYILEYNTNPKMVNTSNFTHTWNLSTVKDMVLINMSYIRSRYFRIRKIIDEYIRELVDKKNPDLKTYMDRLMKANVNKLEPQFNIDDQITSYVKIYDETDSNDLYYKGNLIFNKECLH